MAEPGSVGPSAGSGRDHDALALEQIQSSDELMNGLEILRLRMVSSRKSLLIKTMGQLCQIMEHRVQQFESSEADVAEQSPAAAASTSGAVLDPSDGAMAAMRPGPPQQQQFTSEKKQDHDALTLEQIQSFRDLAPPNGMESKELSWVSCVR